MVKAVCIRFAMSGRITEIDEPEISDAVNDIKLKRFRKETFSLYIYGVCSSCQSKEKRTRSKVSKERI